MRKILPVCKIIQRCVHLDWSPNWKLSKKIADRYRDLDQRCKSQLTYIWIDGTGLGIKAKTRTLDFVPICPSECPIWSFNGKSCHFDDLCDVTLNPIAVYPDPVKQGANKLILCETFTDSGQPTKTNQRLKCVESLKKCCDREPMFTFEQEFVLLDADNRPFGWPVMLGEHPAKNSYYCTVGAFRAYGREILECFFKSCLYAGIQISSVKAEVTPAQWEVQIGPSTGIKAADDLWVARYLLHRIAEDFGLGICRSAKKYGDRPSSNCHTDFSTKEMREEGGLKHIEAAIKKLEKAHAQHYAEYDCKKEEHKFTSGVADRCVSVRISKAVERQKRGYLQDRRVPANADPYRVATFLTGIVCC